MLALQKTTWNVYIGNQQVTVVLDNDISEDYWQSMIQTKAVVTLDWYVLNCAFISHIQKADMTDVNLQTTIAQVKEKYNGAIWEVAIKMSKNNPTRDIHKINHNIQNFISWKNSKGMSLQGYKNFEEYYQLYISAWWDPSLIFNYKQNNDLWA